MEKFERMVKFIQVFEPSWITPVKSTKEKRVVTLLYGNPHRILNVGEQCRGSLFRFNNEVAIVDMGTHQEDFAIIDHLITLDGVNVEAKMTMNYSIVDNREKIQRAISNFEGEMDLLIQKISSILQEYIKNFKAINVRREVSNATNLIMDKLPQVEENIDSCFHVRNLIVANFTVQSSDLNTIATKALKDIETENAQNEITKIKLEKANLEQSFKVNETKGEIELEKIKAENELDLEKQKELHKIEIEKRKQLNLIELEKEKLGVEKLKRDNEILHKKEEAKALQTEHGKMAFYPEETFKVHLKELELGLASASDKHKILVQFLNQTLSNNQSYQSGQLNSLNAVLSRHFNIQLTEQNIQSSSDILREVEKIPIITTDKKIETVIENEVTKQNEINK